MLSTAPIQTLTPTHSIRSRRHIREETARGLPRLRHLIRVTEGALSAPDPECALIYLMMLGDASRELVEDLE